jgi:hypothetical protein
MEVKAALIPRQATMSDNATRHRFNIRNCILICQACVRAATRGANAPSRDLEAAFREKLGETGDAGIHRITNGVDDGCVGQRKVDQAGKEKIRRHLVRVAGHVGTEMALHVMAYNKKRVMRILGVGGLIEAIRA